jgi:hypothetical protein
MISEFCNHNFEPEKLEEEKKNEAGKKIIETKKKKKKRSSSTHLWTFPYHKLAEDKSCTADRILQSCEHAVCKNLFFSLSSLLFSSPLSCSLPLSL